MRTIAKIRIKIMHCTDCGKPLQVGSNTRKVQRCVECGIALMTQNAHEIQAKSGPGYDKWRKGMKRFFDEQSIGGGVPK